MVVAFNSHHRSFRHLRHLLYLLMQVLLLVHHLRLHPPPGLGGHPALREGLGSSSGTRYNMAVRPVVVPLVVEVRQGLVASNSMEPRLRGMDRAVGRRGSHQIWIVVGNEDGHGLNWHRVLQPQLALMARLDLVFSLVDASLTFLKIFSTDRLNCSETSMKKTIPAFCRQLNMK